jgi:hypothetical protein
MRRVRVHLTADTVLNGRGRAGVVMLILVLRLMLTLAALTERMLHMVRVVEALVLAALVMSGVVALLATWSLTPWLLKRV